MSPRLKIQLSLLSGILFWGLYSFFDVYLIILDKHDMTEAYIRFLPQLFLTLFILSTLAYYRFTITKAESINFLDLLWRVFMTGLVTTIISLLIRLVLTTYQDTALVQNPVSINFFYHVYTGLVIVYLVSTFVVWKRFILYQKSKNLIKLWNFFEYSLVLSLGFDFLGQELASNVTGIILVFITTFSLVLSFNLKWIAYLNFQQKLKTILFILLSGIYLYHFYLNLSTFVSREAINNDLLDRVFVVALLLFIFLYAAISILVTLFNLPTSSVFEQKLQETVDFQKLSQGAPSGQSESETYDILIDSSMSAVFADAAWLEILGDENEIINRNINRDQITFIKSHIRDKEIKRSLNFELEPGKFPKRVYTTLPKGDFKSVFAVPIMVKEQQIASLVLLQEVSDAFNKEMVSIITTFVNQASVTIENARLLADAIENERYKEQLKIAKLVQKSLLPETIVGNDNLSIHAFSMAAEEVGGDYYDMINHGEGKFSLMIGDVSGKGTSAAFNMAQLKGVFHSLGQQQLSPKDFFLKANDALSNCLEKSSFITATYFNIDTVKSEIKFARAGHCPTLFYNAKDQTGDYLKTEGMGLGILRNSSFSNYVYENTLTYSPNDVILLYTDGITEAQNSKREQFGQTNLKESFLRSVKGIPSTITKGVINDLEIFLGEEELDDDYTVVTMKFQ